MRYDRSSGTIEIAETGGNSGFSADDAVSFLQIQFSETIPVMETAVYRKPAGLFPVPLPILLPVIMVPVEIDFQCAVRCCPVKLQFRQRYGEFAGPGI